MAVTLAQARKVLGKTGEKMSDDEVRNLMVTADALIDGWMDSYERAIFKGSTINEVLREVAPTKEHIEEGKRWRKLIKKFKKHEQETNLKRGKQTNRRTL